MKIKRLTTIKIKATKAVSKKLLPKETFYENFYEALSRFSRKWFKLRH